MGTRTTSSRSSHGAQARILQKRNVEDSACVKIILKNLQKILYYFTAEFTQQYRISNTYFSLQNCMYVNPKKNVFFFYKEFIKDNEENLIKKIKQCFLTKFSLVSLIESKIFTTLLHTIRYIRSSDPIYIYQSSSHYSKMSVLFFFII